MEKPKDNLKKASEIGSLFDSWIKIILVIGGALISCAMAYYKIFENERSIKANKRYINNQIELLEQRGDKRYDRAMKTATKLEEYGMYHEKRILELEKDDAYLRGRIDERD